MGEEKNSILDKIPEEIKLYNTLYLQYKKYTGYKNPVYFHF